MFQMITVVVIFVIMMAQMTKTHTNILTFEFKKLPILGSTTRGKSAKELGMGSNPSPFSDAYPLRVYTLSVMNICELCVGSLLPGWLSSLY